MSSFQCRNQETFVSPGLDPRQIHPAGEMQGQNRPFRNILFDIKDFKYRGRAKFPFHRRHTRRLRGENSTDVESKKTSQRRL